MGSLRGKHAGKSDPEMRGQEEEDVMITAAPRLKLDQDAYDQVKIGSENLEDAGRSLFEEAREGGVLTDMEFVLDSGRKFRGHRSWLMARCDYIRVMLSSGMLEGSTGIVRVRYCRDGTFLALLEFIYTGRLGDTCLDQDWEELRELAHLFMMEGLEELMLGAVTLSNVEDAARFAVRLGNRELMTGCFRALSLKRPKPSDVNEARRTVRAVNILNQCVGFDNELQLEMDDSWMLETGFSAIVTAMNEHMRDTVVQAKGCAALGPWLRRAMSSNQKAFMDTAKKRGFDAILQALGRHVASAEVAQHGCAALRHASGGERFGTLFRSNEVAGRAQTIVNVLRTHTDNAQIQVDGLVVLQWMVSHDKKCVSSFWRAGGVEAVVHAFRAHMGDALVQEKGCKVLRTLVCNTFESKCQFAASGVAGGVQALVEVLRTHTDNAQIQVDGLAVLQSLCSNHDGNIIENVSRAGRAGGVEAVVQALKVHMTVALVQEYGVSALKDLCSNSFENGNRAVEAGGIEVVTESLKEHTTNVFVQIHGCAALSNFCEHHTVNQRRAAAARSVETVVMALKIHGANAQVLKQGCSTLNALSSVNGCQIVSGIPTPGAVEAVVQVIRDHPTNARVQAEGCRALSSLCGNDIGGIGQSRAGAAMGVEAVVNALILHRAVAEVQGEGCRALSILCDFHDENRDLALAAGGEKAALDTMMTHAKNLKVKMLGRAAWNLLNGSNCVPDYFVFGQV